MCLAPIDGVVMTLVVITVLFSLSLLAAWVLFKFLKSTASVTNPKYQLGGAAAGFVVILSLLSATYIKVDVDSQQTQIDSLKQTIIGLQTKADKGEECLHEMTYEGTVTPPMQEANVVFAVKTIPLQHDGKFSFKSNVKPGELPAIYVVGARSDAPYKQVFEKDDPRNLTIPH